MTSTATNLSQPPPDSIGPTEGEWLLDGDVIVCGPVQLARLCPSDMRFGGYEGAKNPTANGHILAAARDAVEACEAVAVYLEHAYPEGDAAATLRQRLYAVIDKAYARKRR